MAHQMAISQLAAQFSAVDELRGRVGVVLSGASIATGFLAGQALNTATGIPAPAWFAIVFAVALIGTSAFILWPREWDGLTQQADKILDDLNRYPGRDTSTYLQTMAGFAVEAAHKNTRRLTMLYRAFALSLVLLVLDFGGWIWTLAINNGG